MNKMRHIVILTMALVGAVFATQSVSAAEDGQQQERKKVAVVLSGGGVKGMAHIGALKVIEELGIPVDYVVGASIGGVVGGLYAVGYTPAQIDSIARTFNWTDLFSNDMDRSKLSINERDLSERYLLSIPIGKDADIDTFSGLLSGNNITDVFRHLTIGYHDSIDFNTLPVMFACMAKDVVTGKEIAITNGDVATAMRATMSVPIIFKPVRTDNMVLVDGGVSNIYPADVARRMGADIVIGVDVTTRAKEFDNLTDAYVITEQLIKHLDADKYHSNMAQTDIMIMVNTDGHHMADFSRNAVDNIILRGEEAARQKTNMLKELRNTIYATDNDTQADAGKAVHRQAYPYTQDSKLLVREIRFVNKNVSGNNDDSDVRWLRAHCPLKANSEISIAEIEDVNTALSSCIDYVTTTYSLPKHPDGGFILEYHLSKKQIQRVNVGLRFNSEESVSALAGVTLLTTETKRPVLFSLSARLGKRFAAEAGLSVLSAPQQRFNLSYRFEHNDIDITRLNTQTHNATFTRQQADLSYDNTCVRNLRFGMGLRYEYYNADIVLYRANAAPTEEKDHEQLISAFAHVDYNTYNNSFFPMKGVVLHAEGAVYTDDLTHYKDKIPFTAVSTHLGLAYPLGNNLSVIPELYGRILFGKAVSHAKRNCMGGDVMGRYIDHQLPFVGINNVEMTHNTLAIASMKLRQRFASRHYLTLTANYSLNAPKIINLFKGRALFGCGVAYGFDSKLGPMECSINYANHSNKIGAYVNLGYKF